MEAKQENQQRSVIENLPLRPKMGTSFDKLNKELITTNYYKLTKFISFLCYQYDITFQPEVPEDSRAVFKGLIASASKELKERLKDYIHRGKIVWAFVNLEGLQSFKCHHVHNKGTKEEQVFENVLTLKKTKEVDLRTLHGGSKAAQQVLQVLNANLKKLMASAGQMELGRSGKFYNPEDVELIDRSPFKVYRGFTTSIHLINGELNMLIDVSTRIIRKDNLYETMMNCSRDGLEELVGRSVLATYGTWRLYKILKIETKKTVNDSFTNKMTGKQMTYLQYFKEAYGITIKNKDQKLILSSIKKKELNNQGVLVENEIEIHLVPELVNLTGLSEEERSNFNLMKEIAKFTKLTPEERIKEARVFIDKIANSGLFTIEKRETRVEGCILTQPSLIYGDNARVIPVNGIVNQRGRIFKPMDLKDWVLVYTENSDRDRDICDDFVNTLKKSAGAYGIRISDPHYLISPNGKLAEFKEKIERFVEKHGKPPMIVTLLKPKEVGFYGKLKQLMISELGIPHQAVVTKSFDHDKRRLSVCSKILLQMNAKIGNALWKIERRLPSLKDRKILMGGMAIFHKLVNNNQSCCAFAGSVNDDMTEYFLDSKLIPQNMQRFESLKEMIEEWVKTYCQSTKSTPDTIIIYRDGVGESQIQSVIDNEIAVVTACINTIKIKMKQPNYNPGVLFILANKKINQRLYDSERGRSQERAKGAESLGNPKSGTVVGKGISRYGFDFHMSPHNVTEGTCTPTQFNVIHNTTNLTEEEIWTLTFESCFGYFNWAGAVRVPAPLQYANKLATLVGDSMKSEPNGKELKKKIYCL